MSASDIREFRTDAFLEGALAAMARDGFVTDEHDFAPYREVIANKVDEIQEFLQENGAQYELEAGRLEPSSFGPVYYIYDKNRLSPSQAMDDVRKWINQAVD